MYAGGQSVQSDRHGKLDDHEYQVNYFFLSKFAKLIEIFIQIKLVFEPFLRNQLISQWWFLWPHRICGFLAALDSLCLLRGSQGRSRVSYTSNVDLYSLHPSLCACLFRASKLMANKIKYYMSKLNECADICAVSVTEQDHFTLCVVQTSESVRS